MLDIRLIRENPDVVREALKKRGEDVQPLEEVLSIDKQRRELLVKLENLRATHNKLNKLTGAAKTAKTDIELRQVRDGTADIIGQRLIISITPGDIEESRGELIDQQREYARKYLQQEIEKSEKQVSELDKRLQDLLLRLPNIPDKSVPLGKSSEDNPEIRTWGKKPEFSFTPKPHWEIAEKLGIIDFERGVKLSGTRFYVMRGLGSRLQRALINFMLDLHVNEHGYTEIYPPFMVKGLCLYGAGQLPKFGDNLYHDAEEDLWWVPTAEVPLTNLHRDEILPPGSLPIYYVAYTACFRREKMAAGKDTRGIKRGHQFDKVEMYKFTEPDKSFDELEKLVHDAEDVVQKLGLPYRIIQLCTADIGFASAKSYDVEVWAPGFGEWLEVSSCSNCVDFQARRANIRYRPEPTAKPQFPHTLNGSGLALPRIVIAILENYQQADGTVVVPEVLRKYMGVDVIR